MDVNDIEVVYEVVSPNPKDTLNEKFANVIFRLVKKHTGYSKDDLNTISRKRKFVEARQLNMYFLKEHTNYTLEKIGKYFERDHATVLHAVKTINNLIETDKEIRLLSQTIKSEIDVHLNKFSKTKYSVFQELLESTIEDEEERQKWFDEYFDAK